MSVTMQNIEEDSQLRRSIQKIILDNLNSEQNRHCPLKRRLLSWNRWRFQMAMSKFLGFDLSCPIETDTDRQLTLGERWHRYKKQKEAPKLYLLVVSLLVVSTISNWFNLYFQYTYDLNLALLREIDSRAGTSQKNTSAIATNARLGAEEARVWLKFLGSAHLEWHLVGQMIYWYFGFFAIAYVTGSIYMRIFDMDHFSWFRWLVNAERESDIRARLTMAEMARIHSTMVLSAETEFDKLEEAASAVSDSVRFKPRAGEQYLKREAGSNRRSSFVLSQMESRRELIDRTGRKTFEQLRRVALAGRLNPLNRTHNSLGKLETRALLIDLVQYLVTVSYAICGYYAFKFMFARIGSHVEFVSYRDYIQAFNLLYPILLCYVVCVPITSFSLVVGYESAQSIVLLKSLLLQTIHSNEVLFRKIRAASSRSGYPRGKLASLIDEISDNLLVALIQYRLSANEYKLSLRYFKYFGVVYMSLALFVPVLARTHCPYMSLEMKPYLIIVTIMHTFPSFLGLLPHCNSNQKCVETFKLLNSVAAHLIEHASIKPLEECPSVHLIQSLLARELTDPERALAKFSNQVLWLDITYATMLRMASWALLVQMPTLRISKSDDIVGEFLDDPLGVFKQLQ